jgi:hypothetical protein
LVVQVRELDLSFEVCPPPRASGCGGQTAVVLSGLTRRATGMCSLGWPAVPPAARSSAWRRTTAGTPRRRRLIEVRQRPTAHTPRAAGHVSTERKVADSRRATTALPTSGHRQPELRHSLPNRVVGVNTNTRWAPPAPTGRRPAPLVAGRVFGSRRKGRRGFDY